MYNILLYKLPALANQNGILMYWNVPNGLMNAVQARLSAKSLQHDKLRKHLEMKILLLQLNYVGFPGYSSRDNYP